MLAQRRVLSLIDLFAAPRTRARDVDRDRRLRDNQPHLYGSAALTLILKVILLPWLLYRLIRSSTLKWDVEQLINISDHDAGRHRAVVLRLNLAVPISQLASTVTRATLGIAMACVMLSFLMMITRRKAIPQVIGSCRWRTACSSRRPARRTAMPMVVDSASPLDVLVGMLILGRLLLPDSRAVRQPRFEAHGKAERVRVKITDTWDSSTKTRVIPRRRGPGVVHQNRAGSVVITRM